MMAPKKNTAKLTPCCEGMWDDMARRDGSTIQGRRSQTLVTVYSEIQPFTRVGQNERRELDAQPPRCGRLRSSASYRRRPKEGKENRAQRRRVCVYTSRRMNSSNR